MLPQAVSPLLGKPWSAHADCRSCVGAGFGWSIRRARCGMFATTTCGEGSEERRAPQMPNRMPHSAWLPRVRLAELLGNQTLLGGGLPFVLTDSATAWPATQGRWSTAFLGVRAIPGTSPDGSGPAFV